MLHATLVHICGTAAVGASAAGKGRWYGRFDFELLPGAGLKDVITGETLCDEKAPVILERMEFPGEGPLQDLVASNWRTE